ncbi:hypothetical protein [Helicobacter pylori]|nr:hypothetical protein [Helicobacter pylori]
MNRIFTIKRYDKSDKTAFFKIATHYTTKNPKSSKFSPHTKTA